MGHNYVRAHKRKALYVASSYGAAHTAVPTEPPYIGCIPCLRSPHLVVADIVMAYLVIAYAVMADIVMAYIVMAYIVMAHIVMAYIGMAYTIMAHIVMAHIVGATPTEPLYIGCIPPLRSPCPLNT